jgi:hypothetical protein
LIARGWHKSGYLFDITGADTDGWVEHTLSMRFPPTTRFREAIVQVVRYPTRRDYTLKEVVDGKETSQTMALEETLTLRIPLSALRATSAELSAAQSFPLGAPDTRSRSYRVVNIDFD